MIRVEGLRKTYRMGAVEVRALDGVTLDVRQGEFVGITGPSGSGKSTLLHLIGLLDEPSGGTISIQGTDVLALSDDERTLFRLTRIGYIFQDYALVPDLTALENVVVPTLAAGLGEREGIVRAADLLRRVGLGERTGHLPSELSGGSSSASPSPGRSSTRRPSSSRTSRARTWTAGPPRWSSTSSPRSTGTSARRC